MTEKWTRAPKLVLWGAEYDGQGRAYVDPTDDNARFPSVTSILKHAPKADLMGWAAMKVAERARDRPDIVMGDPDLVVQRLQYAHTDYRDERGEVGTGVHAKIQADFEDSWDFPKLNEEQERILLQFRDFCRVYQVKILQVEFTVKISCGVMGTADAIIEYTEPLTGEVKIGLVDWKTSKKIWEEHMLQLSALAHGDYLLEEVAEGEGFLRKGRVKAENSWWKRAEMPKFDAVAAIHLREDFWSFEELDKRLWDVYYEKYKAYVAVEKASQAIKEALK